MEPREEIHEHHRQRGCQTLEIALQEDPGCLIVEEERQGVEHPRNHIHAVIVMRWEKIADAIKEPDNRSLEIRKLHVWPHADDEGLTLHVEPGGIDAVSQSKEGGVIGEEQLDEEWPEGEKQ